MRTVNIDAECICGSGLCVITSSCADDECCGIQHVIMCQSIKRYGDHVGHTYFEYYGEDSLQYAIEELEGR